MWIILIAEVCLSFPELVLAANTIFGLFCATEARVRQCYRLLGQSAPTVDVFITSCGEPVDVVIDTVATTVAQDYPSDRFRVLVLDDGHDEELQDAVKRLGKRSAEESGPPVLYFCRKIKPGVRSYFKAGNLQFGLEESSRLGGSEYVASLDADMMPEPDWLRRMVPHLILQDDLALATPPQVSTRFRSPFEIHTNS